MAVPIPNITGGAATAGDIFTTTDLDFGPVNVGGLFGSGASSENGFLLPAIVLGVALVAFAFLRKR